MDGSVFLLARDENSVLKYDSDLSFLKLIGGRGEGPDGIEYANKLSIVNNRLFVYCAAYVSEFSLEGKPIQKYRNFQEDAQYDLAKIKVGWLCIGNHSYTNNTAELRWFSDDFSAKKMITSWTRDEHYPIPGKALLLNPALSTVKLVVASDHQTFFLKLPNQDVIYIYEDLDQKPTPIKVVAPKVPFDEIWGSQQLDLLTKTYPKLKFKPVFPAYYPVIRNMSLTPHGLLALGITGKKGQIGVQFRDQSGTPIDFKYDKETIERTISLRSGFAYILIQDHETEEYGVAKCPESQLNEFIKSNTLLPLE